MRPLRNVRLLVELRLLLSWCRRWGFLDPYLWKEGMRGGVSRRRSRAVRCSRCLSQPCGSSGTGRALWSCPMRAPRGPRSISLGRKHDLEREGSRERRQSPTGGAGSAGNAGPFPRGRLGRGDKGHHRSALSLLQAMSSFRHGAGFPVPFLFLLRLLSFCRLF